VGITSGPEDAPDVLLEREAVEIGKNETYRSLCARLIKKNNFNIVNLKNLEGYLLEQVADDIILATRPPPQTIWMEIAILEADDDVLREVRNLRQQAVSHKEDHRRWISETDELRKTVTEYMEQSSQERKEKDEAKRTAKDLRKKLAKTVDQLQQSNNELDVRANRIAQLEEENSRYLAELQRFRSLPSASGEQVKNLNRDLKRKDNYIANLQASLQQTQAQQGSMKQEIDRLRKELEKQKHFYMNNRPAPIFKPAPQKKLPVRNIMPAAPPPKAFPSKGRPGLGWSPKTSVKSKSSPKKSFPDSRVIQRPEPATEKSVNDLKPRVIERPSSGIGFGDLGSGGGWSSAKKAVKAPSQKKTSLSDQFGAKNPFDFSGEHNKKKKKKKKKK